jgi:hypothetical protein
MQGGSTFHENLRCGKFMPPPPAVMPDMTLAHMTERPMTDRHKLNEADRSRLKACLKNAFEEPNKDMEYDTSPEAARVMHQVLTSMREGRCAFRIAQRQTARKFTTIPRPRTTSTRFICAGCTKIRPAIKQFVRCKGITHCSRVCQKKHWTLHKNLALKKDGWLCEGSGSRHGHTHPVSPRPRKRAFGTRY